ncbi:MAG: ferric uptake regulator, Fur family [Solirubrobacterales bacterium]|nr:ferric uptake regulator, Fur family [Solirubrobacterales bacterium]
MSRIGLVRSTMAQMSHGQQSAAWPEHAASVLTTAGYRSGGARQAVVDLLARQDCALSAFELEARLGRTKRKVARASVYRVLEELESLKLVARIEVGDGIARFEPIAPGGEHHHHFVCDDCGDLSPFHDEELERVIARVAKRMAFEVDDHDITLRGACERCRT